MAGDLNVGLNGANSAFQAFRDLTVGRSHNQGTLNLVKNENGEVTELKCANHHFWKFWANDSRSVTMASANELRSVFERAVDIELQKCFEKILGDDSYKKDGVTGAERDALLNKMKAIKETFHRAIFPDGCEETKMAFTRKDIGAIVKNVDKLVSYENLSVDALLAADTQSLCQMATNRNAAGRVSFQTSQAVLRTKVNVTLAKEAMTDAKAERILSASSPLVEFVFPQIKDRLSWKPQFSKFFNAVDTCRGELNASQESLDRKSLADEMKNMINVLRKGLEGKWPENLDKEALNSAISDSERVVQSWETQSQNSTLQNKGVLDASFQEACRQKIDNLYQVLQGLQETFDENMSTLLEPLNRLLEKNDISTVCFGADGKLVLREPIKLEGEILDNAVREDVAWIIDDIGSGSELLEEVQGKKNASNWDTTDRRRLAAMEFQEALSVGDADNADPTLIEKSVERLDEVTRQMKQEFVSDSDVKFGVYAKPKPVPEPPKPQKSSHDLLRLMSFDANQLGIDNETYAMKDGDRIKFDREKFVKAMREQCKGKDVRDAFCFVMAEYSTRNFQFAHLSESLRNDFQIAFEICAKKLLDGYEFKSVAALKSGVLDGLGVRTAQFNSVMNEVVLPIVEEVFGN